MPTYVYRCPTCGTKSDIQLSLKELDKEVPCLVCAAAHVFDLVPFDRILMRRVPSAAAVHFKGSGFYSTGG